MARVGIVYFKDPLAPKTGMDLIRWHEISVGLWKLGHIVDMISPQTITTKLKKGLYSRNIREVDWSEYNVIKTRNHSDISLVPDHEFIISRIGRVVDSHKPTREFAIRAERLKYQEEIHRRARYVSFTSQENMLRWIDAYPGGPTPLLVPTGCPKTIPSPGSNPYFDLHNVLFLGSLTSSRFVEQLNTLGKALHKYDITLCFLGRNQLDLYGETDERLNNNYVNNLGCVSEEATWNYVFYADAGVVFARGTDLFDNESSKLYYYLRAGLPVVSEEYVANNFLIDETGFGTVAKYGDIDDMVHKILAVTGKRDNQVAVQNYMMTTHAWENRAMIYSRIIAQELKLNRSRR